MRMRSKLPSAEQPLALFPADGELPLDEIRAANDSRQRPQVPSAEDLQARFDRLTDVGGFTYGLAAAEISVGQEQLAVDPTPPPKKRRWLRTATERRIADGPKSEHHIFPYTD